MEHEHYQEMMSLLSHALELGPAERLAFVQGASARNPALGSALLSLLEEVERAPEFLSTGGAETLTLDSARHTPFDLPQRIGPYRLIRLLNAGGMGEVYLAEQDMPLRRLVAIKLIRRDLAPAVFVRRFEEERQVLALMNHDNIAQVFGAGATDGGQPYIAMEYVEGSSLDSHCEEKRLDLRARLELFCQVCRGVQHAHQRGVIHRDLKPSNILVAVQDNRPVPKIIDFGIAKAFDPNFIDRQVMTIVGQVIGTPEYMSPEQTLPDNRDIDTRTDVYSLGMILYILLVGDFPYDFKLLEQSGGYESKFRAIREVEPPSPSRRIMAHASAGGIPGRAREDLQTRSRTLSGELDWITLKALEKDRTHRYQSASALAEDVERYLRDEPVLAGPASNAYRLRKYVKRNRGTVTAATAVLLAILGFGSLSLWQAWEARTEGLRSKAIGILASASSAKDPLVKALLVHELDGMPGLTLGELSKAQSALESPLPVAIIGTQYSGDIPLKAALSPNGTRVAIAYKDGAARIWQADGSGAPVVLKGHQQRIDSIAFSPDGSRIVTTGWDRTLRVWPSAGGNAIVLRGHSGEVYQAAFSSDGRRIVTASADETARIWPADGIGSPIVLRGHSDGVQSASFSPDGNLVATASFDGTARVWSVDGSRKPLVLLGHEAPVSSALFSPDGQHVLTIGDDRTVRVWRTDGRERAIVLKHDGKVNSAEFSNDGQSILTASDDRTARIWRMDGTGTPIVLEGHTAGVWSAHFSPDSTHVLTASEDGTARLWEPYEAFTSLGRLVQWIPAGPYRGRKVRFRVMARIEKEGKYGNATLILHIESDGQRETFDISNERPVEITSSQWREYEAVGEVANDAEIIHLGLNLVGPGHVWIDEARLETVDGQTPEGAGLLDGACEAERPRWFGGLADGGYRAVAVKENPAEGHGCLLFERHPVLRYRATLLAGHGSGIRITEFDAAGKSVMTFAGDGAVRVWKADPGGEPRIFRHEDEVGSAAFSPDGLRIVTTSVDGIIRMWRIDLPGEPIVFRGHTDRVERASFSPDGLHIVSTSLDHTARVWNADGDQDPVVLSHAAAVVSAEFSPDSQHIATVSGNGIALLWRSDGTGKPLVLANPAGFIDRLKFCPDGRSIALAAQNGTVTILRVDGTGKPVVLRGHGGPVQSASFSSDGMRIATAAWDGTVRVWPADGTGQPVVIHAPTLGFEDAEFSPDDRRIVGAADDGNAFVWLADGTGEPLMLRGHEGPIWRAEFSPDGQKVITAGADGTVRLWRVTWEAMFDYLRANVRSCLRPEERVLYLGEERSQASEQFARCETQLGSQRRVP